MKELIDRLTQKAGLSEDQATKAIATIKEFVKDKFPMMAGAVDNLLGSDAPASTTTTASTATNAAAGGNDGSFLDKISDYIPGEMGQKAEDFAKDMKNKFTGGN